MTSVILTLCLMIQQPVVFRNEVNSQPVMNVTWFGDDGKKKKGKKGKKKKCKDCRLA